MVISLLTREINPKRSPPFDFDQVKAGMSALGFDNSQEALFCREAARFMFTTACGSTAVLRRGAAGRKEKPTWKFAAKISITPTFLSCAAPARHAMAACAAR
ncbi:hypothetical protein GCM10007923_03730 [Shinella yambaruensis]|uniref:Uncharacterized protein n=1 Tax=Shinella yambaruensis TaxID=415996 RepID=A0ABQ5Z8N8_9HYPH|nr:hypothetical protein GCM10007923_03730 [Shinella yambaruensis]